MDGTAENAWLSQELSSLAAPQDPDLVLAYTTTDAGPRVAVVCFLYQLASMAGLTGTTSADFPDRKKQQAGDAATHG